MWSEAYTSTTLPLDRQLGAGQVDALAAAEQYAAGECAPGTVPTTGWDLGEIEIGDAPSTYAFDTTLSEGVFITATLAWDRRIMLTQDANGDGIFDLRDNDIMEAAPLNNLDINIFNSDDELVFSSESTIDNLEHLYWLVPEEDDYYLTVAFQEQLDTTVQEYTLAWNVSDPPGNLFHPDINEDGLVDGSDLSFVLGNFGPEKLYQDAHLQILIDSMGSTGGQSYLVQSIPEPSSCMLLLVGLVALGGLRWKL